MAKMGRNEPCPCGSGKKYKRCCLPRDEAAADARRQTVASMPPARAPWGLLSDDDSEGLDDASNRVVDLINAGRLDEAESAARDLLARYPDVVDGLERLARVYEVRGDHRHAAEYYRKAVDFIGDDDRYAPEMVDFLRQKADALTAQVEHDP
jgi:tetratricopeptide (TPR) repeat protein